MSVNPFPTSKRVAYPVLLLLTLLTNLTLAPLDSRLCVIIGFPFPRFIREDDDGGPVEHEDAAVDGAEASGGDDAALADVGMGIGGLAGIWNTCNR